MVSGPYKRVMNWEDDISLFEGMEIVVDTRERFPISSSISHNFVSIAILRFIDLIGQPVQFSLFLANLPHLSLLPFLAPPPGPEDVL